MGIENFPVSGPNAGRPGDDDFTAVKIGIAQDVPNGGRRRAAVAGALADFDVARAELATEQRRVRVETATAWVSLAFAERRLAALDQLVAGLKALWDGQPASVASGSSRPAAGLLPRRLQAEFADRRSELVADAEKARVELTRWTGDPAPSTSGALPPYQIEPVSLRAGLELHPSVEALQAAVGRSDAEVDAARAAKRPDWGIEASYARRDPKFGDMVSAGVTVSLPLFSAARQGPVITARAAEASRARAVVEDRRRALLASLETQLADHQMHHERWRRAVEVLVPNAEQTAQLETSSYAAGRADYGDLVEAFTGLADAKLLALEREALVARESASLVLNFGRDDR